MADRPDVPDEMLGRLQSIFTMLPRVVEERAWVGVRWQVGKATVAHVFGGEDQRFRVTFRAELDEVLPSSTWASPTFEPAGVAMSLASFLTMTPTGTKSPSC